MLLDIYLENCAKDMQTWSITWTFSTFTEAPYTSFVFDDGRWELSGIVPGNVVAGMNWLDWETDV
jgi:hypothetical protein